MHGYGLMFQIPKKATNILGFPEPFLAPYESFDQPTPKDSVDIFKEQIQSRVSKRVNNPNLRCNFLLCEAFRSFVKYKSFTSKSISCPTPEFRKIKFFLT